MDDTLEQQLAAIAKGDEAAFEVFYDETINRVYGLALRIARSPDVAEEVVSDTYYQVWTQAKRYKAGRGTVLGWLLMMCRSRAIDHLRRRDSAVVMPDPSVFSDEATAGGDNPGDILQAIEQNSAVRSALEKLDPVQRQMLSLAFFRGYTHAEIAAYTGMPLGSVKTWIRKALKIMKQALPAYNPEGQDRP